LNVWRRVPRRVVHDTLSVMAIVALVLSLTM